MPTRYRSMLLAGAAALALIAAPARAADVTAAQANEVESQVRAWLGSITGPALKIGERPMQVTAAGDHFDVAVPIRVRSQGSPVELRLTASARPLDGGKWAVENIRMNSPMRFTMDMPMPGKDGAKTTQLSPVDYTIDIAGQDGSMMLDPSFATPSTWTVSMKGLTSRAAGQGIEQTSRLGASNTVATIKPAGGDRVDFTSEGTLEDYHIESRSEGLEPIVADMRLVRVSAGMTGLSRSKAVTVTQGVTTLIAAGLAAMPATGTGPSTTPKVAPELIRTLLGALTDFASALDVDETFEGFAVKYGDFGMALERMRLGFGARSDRGLLQARMDLGAEGLTLPDLPLGGMEALLPRRVAMRPFVSNIGVAELMRIAQAGSEGRDPSPADLSALFSNGGIVAGLESMGVEVAGALFAGQGKVTVLSPTSYSGAAQVTAENFDALMQKVSGMPPLAQAVPVMAFVKGIGRNVENRLVWDITYRDNKLLVNNVDLSAMAGGPPPAPGGAQKTPPPRNQQQQQRQRP